MTTARLTKPALGVLMGASIALAASAVAGQAGSSWFSGSFATGGSGSAGAGSAWATDTPPRATAADAPIAMNSFFVDAMALSPVSYRA